MTRIYLKFSLPLIVSALLAVLLVRATPYDDAALRDFLTPPQDCAAPCFMGIQVGITTVDEAVTILRAHPWVSDLREFGRDVSWRWSGEQPLYLDGKRTGWLLGYEGVVFSLKMTTTISLGDIWLHTYPESGRVFSEVSSATPFSVYRAPNLQYALIFSLDSPCPPARFWRQGVNFTFQPNMNWLEGFDDSPNQFFRICQMLARKK